MWPTISLAGLVPATGNEPIPAFEMLNRMDEIAWLRLLVLALLNALHLKLLTALLSADAHPNW